MAEKRLIKKKKKKGEQEEKPLTKDETDVAKYLRWNLPSKTSVMYGDKVQYFIGSKAVDFLLDSKWATGKAKSSVEITDRESACILLDRFLMLGLISRVYRIRKEKKGKEKDKDKKQKKDDKDKAEQKSGESEGADSPKQSPKAKKKDKGKEKEESKDSKKKKKVKVSLEPHHDQLFVDEDEAYVWIYDPVHPKTFVLGILVVLGVVAVCLFPLWPDSMREYSWYLSVFAAIFVGFIFLLAILRYVVFAVLWVLTIGKLRFWFLPNLTEDCGFFESFVPAYEYEYRGQTKASNTEEEKIDDDTKEEEEVPAVEKSMDTGTTSTDEIPQTVDAKVNDKENSESSSSNRDDDENETEAWVKVKRTDVDEEKNGLEPRMLKIKT